MEIRFKDISAMDDKLVSANLPLLSMHGTSWYRDFFKRGLDILFAVLSAPIALPILAVVALLVRRDGSTAFYRQWRVGKNGKEFSILKVRTMVPDADSRLAEYLDENPLAKREWETTQKLKDDPRITSIGRFLRKSSIDELPQLWNVLLGDMSLVGPRPMMVDQKEMYPGLAYYELRPGITGPWQISDRNQTTFAERAKYDTTYYSNLSFKTDFGILGRTIGVVLRCTGY